MSGLPIAPGLDEGTSAGVAPATGSRHRVQAPYAAPDVSSTTPGMHNYSKHLEARHRARQLRPDLMASRRVPAPSPETVAIAELLPLARRSTATDLRFDVKSVDGRGRIALTEACRTLQWVPHVTRVEMTRGDGFLAVRASAGPGPSSPLLSQHRLLLPTWAQDLVGLHPGSQVLAIVDLAGEVRLHPAGIVAEALRLLPTAAQAPADTKDAS